jgi:hypothetical protein
MADAIVISNEELAILCDIVAGWSAKRAASLDTDKRQVLDRLIANGFIQPVAEPALTKYQHTAKTELLFAQLCVGISGG